MASAVGPLGNRGPGPVEAFSALVALVLFELGVSSALPPPDTKVEAIGITGAVRGVEILLLLGYWKGRGWALSDLGLAGMKARSGWRTGIWIAFGFGGLVGLCEILGRMLVGRSLLAHIAGTPPRGAEIAALLAAGVILGPLLEELVFRGILYGGLRKRFGPCTAVPAVTLLFAGAHRLTAGVPWVQAVGGILFCVAYEMTGSLWAPLVIHASGNLAIFLLPFWIR